ncbi:MAG: hypothetical protein ACUVTB_03265 [Candidatus Bathycorpusculaceae bacterium]
MNVLVDDVGSFPLPHFIDKKLFNNVYALARQAIIKGENIKKEEFLLNNFYNVIIGSFKKKLETGLDIVNYPQHYDIHGQFTEIIQEATNKGTYVVEEKSAIIPEIYVLKEEAERLSKEIGKKISLRVCITGPMELYLKMIGTIPYKDVLLMFAENVKRFAKKSILNSKYIKTEVVSLDEPSFGFQDVTADKDTIITVFEKAFDFSGVVKQIHIHSSSRVTDLLAVKNLDVLSFEYAASPKNIEAVSKRMLEEADKQIRVGISRTDIDSIIAELYEKGVKMPNGEQLVESEDAIKRRFLKAKEKYEERMTFTGPDCGLGGWPTQEAAQLLLKRTANAVKSAT